MIKKIFKVFIILNLIFLSSLNVNAEEREFDIENFNNEFENKNGLIKENEKLVYYEKGQKIIGFKKIDDKLYFFSSKDYAATQGWKAAYGNVWYQDETGEVLRGIQIIDEKTYFFNEETGYQEVGFKNINNELYYFSGVTKCLSSGWKAAYGNVWYQDETGRVLRGVQTIDGKTYFFNEKTGYQEVGFKNINNELYYFSGVTKCLSSGWKAAYGNVWYQDETGKVLRGVQTIDGKTYFFNDKTGYQEVGFKNINNELYYFSGVTKYLTSGWKAAYGKVWYQDETGKVLKGYQIIDENKYYFDEVTGYRFSGFKKINEKIYFFNSSTGTTTEGWKAAYNKIWYQTSEGYLITGEESIEGRNYRFDENGFLQGFKYMNNKMYYYNPDGSQAKGVQRMAGTYYKFDSITGEFKNIVNQKIVIDVSAHNGNINWEQVKNAGIVDGVILRLGYSVGFVDTYFLRNVNELNRLGIPYSVYLFSYAVNPYEAGLEADFVIRTIRNNPVKIASNLFSIYYDLEDWTIKSTGENSNEISKDAYGGIITTFADKIKSNLGINARVYASKNYVYERFPSYAWPYATWIAQWGPAITYKEAFEGWQYTNNGSIPGINGRVDMSIFYY